jgi:hypothetical protein
MLDHHISKLVPIQSELEAQQRMVEADKDGDRLTGLIWRGRNGERRMALISQDDLLLVEVS